MFKLIKVKEDRYTVHVDSLSEMGAEPVAEFYKEVDGYFVCRFNGSSGSWSQLALGEIAAKLQHLNKEWDSALKRDLYISGRYGTQLDGDCPF